MDSTKNYEPRDFFFTRFQGLIDVYRDFSKLMARESQGMTRGCEVPPPLLGYEGRHTETAARDIVSGE